MAAHGLAKRAEVGADLVKVRRRTRPRAMRPTDAAQESPAVALQMQLSQALAEEPAVEGRWSARRSLAFTMLFNGVFWAGLAVVISRVVASAH